MKTVCEGWRFLVRARGCFGAALLVVIILWLPASGEVLPEERADALYHSYDGGGVRIDGPSLLMRKNFGEKFSVSGNYYVDSITSASIDVVTTASPYTEERTQTSLGFKYLMGNTGINVGFAHSDENDYTADTVSVGISQTLFGDLTTFTMGYARGSDEVRRNGDADFLAEIDRRHYRLGLTQILTQKLIAGLSFETITDEGFLNNPYRSVRFLDPDSGTGYSFEPELYPNTRTSNALALRARYFLPYRAALHGEYRFYTDTWDIDADTFTVGYTHPTEGGLTFDVRFRMYSQSAAEFYSDLFPRAEAFNFRARDKELSRFDSRTLGFGVSYEILREGWGFIDRGTLNLRYDRMQFDYGNFRDLTQAAAPGSEPLYELDADVLQLYLSIWF